MANVPMPEVRYVDDPLAPELFARGASGFAVGDGFITITLESRRIDHSVTPAPVNRVVVARLTLPINGAMALVVQLNDFLNSHGLNSSMAASGGVLPN